MSEPTLVVARLLDPGDCFRKRNGEFVFLRISDSAVKHSGLDPTFVWGVCYNGNMCKISPDTLVHPEPLSGISANQKADEDWHQMVSGTSPTQKCV